MITQSVILREDIHRVVTYICVILHEDSRTITLALSSVKMHVKITVTLTISITVNALLSVNLHGAVALSLHYPPLKLTETDGSLCVIFREWP